MVISKNLLGLENTKREEIALILKTAQQFKEVLSRPIPKVPTLRGKTVVNLFFESSTRTRISFELAEKRLSADTISFTTSGSSVSKGETLKDTVRNIEAMKIDMVVIRHQSAGAPHMLAHMIEAGVINAGDGQHEHPTQALLDMMTLTDKFGKLEGLKIALVGDIQHSRVARSNIFGLQAMGARVAMCGPATLLPRDYREAFGSDVEVFTNVDDAIRWADVLNVLRLQLERQRNGLFPSLREYAATFGINRARLEAAKKNVVIMHPGPINRGVELDNDIADSEYSVILDQVTNGVAVRMATLYLKCGGDLEVVNGNE
ncbi:aspartate carbamoyltransferase catalytic subunit [candidate division KSB1 bacterium]|nr:aspartate carbamoyltransferase catalytic subunit [candidate division KSB1 bacterium]